MTELTHSYRTSDGRVFCWQHALHSTPGLVTFTFTQEVAKRLAEEHEQTLRQTLESQ